MSAPRISYAQNGEDIRVWRAFGDDGRGRTYVDVGANEHRRLSITASLHDLGWRGLLVEADPDLAAELRVRRPGDVVVEAAAAEDAGELAFYRVPGTGLGTLDADEADAARARGFEVHPTVVRSAPLDTILDEHEVGDVHFMSIDVEGAEASVLAGLRRHRPWVLCVEAVLPGTTEPSHGPWEPGLLARGYVMAAFDGVNRWYVAKEHADLVRAVATPFNAVDAGQHGWAAADLAALRSGQQRTVQRRAWQRELILDDLRSQVPAEEYERQIDELRTALVAIQGSRAYRLSERLARTAKGGLFRARALAARLPGPVSSALVRRRHLRHVRVNMGHLTDPAFLGDPPDGTVDWLDPAGLPAPPAGGLGLGPMTAADAAAAQDWLAAGPYDDDALLERRTDNHGDEVGRTMAALRTRLALADRPPSPHWAGGRLVLVDARSLQDPAFGHRGIGRFARAAVAATREAVGDGRVVLLVDAGLEPLDPQVAGSCRTVTEVPERAVSQFSVLVQPSPMTGSPEPLVAMLHGAARKLAVVFDFIPLAHPALYLRHPAARAEYAASLDALRRYDEFACISHVTRTDLARWLGRPVDGPDAVVAQVAWPRDLRAAAPAPDGHRPGSGPIVVMTGDEPRKNTFGALAAIGAATAADKERDVIVVGMAGQDVRVHHWSIAAAMRPGEARTAGRLTEAEMTDLLGGARAVVVASFDEGLSLPVIEAVMAGGVVVASDIPAHRELIGPGAFLGDPGDVSALARAIRRTAGRPSVAARQARALGRHAHADLEDVVCRSLAAHAKSADVVPPAAAVHVGGRALRVGIATPWWPQRTGVADFSTATTLELARIADVTVYASSSARVEESTPAGVRLRSAPVADARPGREDVLVSVVGNSHFHLPSIDLAARTGCVVVAHDARLVELYLALRGRGALEQVMLRGTGRTGLVPPLDDQIEDMRLLQNAGFWEVARRARMLVLHAPAAAARIEAETGVRPRLLPFATQRVPRQEVVTDDDRVAARTRLGMSPDATHLATFGFVDVRTKLTDVVVEAAAWLTQWGRRVELHLVGSAPEHARQALEQRARQAGIAGLHVTGFVDDGRFRDYLLAVDAGVQLRVSPLLGVSGPLSDLAAYGTPALASAGLAADVDAPAFVRRLPDEVSPVGVAEAVEALLASPMPQDVREQARREYLQRKSPRRYAELLLELLGEAAAAAGRPGGGR
ncbi:MAG: FkbM family methyltransferase [Candidatus Nanopelagicales bacterium]